jgi:hypothetical protein
MLPFESAVALSRMPTKVPSTDDEIVSFEGVRSQRSALTAF